MDPHDFEQRLTNLEVKATFTEDALDRLNEVVIRQQRQIDLLMRELMELKRQPASDGLDTLRSLRDELPPHY